MVKVPLSDWFEKRDIRVQELANEVTHLKAKHHYPHCLSISYLTYIRTTNGIDEYLNLCRLLRGIVDETKQWIDLKRETENQSVSRNGVVPVVVIQSDKLNSMESIYHFVQNWLKEMESIYHFVQHWLKEIESRNSLPIPSPYNQPSSIHLYTLAALPERKLKQPQMKAFHVSDLTEQEKRQVYQYVIKRDFAVSDLSEAQRNKVYQEVMREKRAKRTRKQHDIHAKALAHYHREAERTKQETGKAISKNAFAAQYCKQYKCVESTLREWLKEK